MHITYFLPPFQNVAGPQSIATSSGGIHITESKARFGNILRSFKIKTFDMEGVLALRGGLILKFLGFHCQYSPGVVPFFVIRTFLMLERQGLTYDELFCFFFVIAIQKKMRFSGMPTITINCTLNFFDIL